MKPFFIFLLVSLVVLPSCYRTTRQEAKDNTAFNSGFPVSQMASFDSRIEGLDLSELVSKFGWPLWLRNLGSGEIEDDLETIRNSDYSNGEFRFWYSSQKNGAQDFLRLTVLIDNGSVIEVENIWYLD